MEAEKRTNRASIDSEVFELASRHPFVLEPDYTIVKEAATYVTVFFFLQENND